MLIHVHGQGIKVGSATRDFIEHRLGFSLGRLRESIQRVEVFLADVNGPRGGEDKLGRVIVYLPRQAPVVIEEKSGSLTHLINRAADRVGQSVRRILGRFRNRRTSGK
jgi:ribosome-associated translation inhibitor RaiA